MGPKLDTPKDGRAENGQADLPGPPESADQSQRRQLADRLVRATDAGTALGELRKRAEQLPCGHPSSPWNEDGSRRAPEKAPADFELPETGLSDADYATHVSEVVEGLDQALAAGLATDRQFGATHDGDIWTQDRADIQDEIIASFYSAATDVPCEGLAIIAGGLPGAGKTTVLDQQADIDRANYLTINPDDFKDELARRGLIPEVEGLSPMEASALAHEESSYMARQLALHAMADGKNIIWDVTMSSEASTARRLHELRAAGYQRVDGIFVEIPIDTSLARAEARHRCGHDQYLAGVGLGGRYPPPDMIQSKADPEYGSTNRRTFEHLKGQFDRWKVYDNSVDGNPAVLVAEGRGTGAKLDLLSRGS